MNSPKKIAFFTLGCKVNQYETFQLKNQFLKNGFKEVLFSEYADIYIINTCTVTSIADRKSRNIIRRAKKQNAEAIVVAMGCYVETNSEKINFVDLLITGSAKKNVYELVIEKIIEKDDNFVSINSCNEGLNKTRLRAFIKIQDGCNLFCSYCKIPFARNKILSKPLKEIKKEVMELSDSFKEIVLIGINLSLYGDDLKENIDLVDVIKELSEIEKIKRIRVGSIYLSQITDKFLNEFNHNLKLMPHLHISLQSCDDKILKTMQRKYNSNDILKKLLLIGSLNRDINITSDIIVGFPGEGEKEFATTYNFLKKSLISCFHVFPYSKREKTKAILLTDQIDPFIIKKRSQRLLQLSKKKSAEYNESKISKKVKVFIEKINENIGEGYSEDYVKTKIVNCDSKLLNEIIEIKIKNTTQDCLIGEGKWIKD